jgi:hypothetical protein
MKMDSRKSVRSVELENTTSLASGVRPAAASGLRSEGRPRSQARPSNIDDRPLRRRAVPQARTPDRETPSTRQMSEIV